MGAAARARVHTRDPHHANLALVVLLAAEVHRLELLGGGEKRLDLHVLANRRVGATLNLERLVCREDAVKVDFDAPLAHVEAHVVVAKERVDDARHHVLAGMGLHVVAAPRPVERTVHVGAHGERRVREVQHALAALARDRLSNVRGDLVLAIAAGERAPVAGLAATRGVERRLVQLDGKVAVTRGARRHGCVELARVGLPVVQLVKGLHVPVPPMRRLAALRLLTAAHDRSVLDCLGERGDGVGCREVPRWHCRGGFHKRSTPRRACCWIAHAVGRMRLLRKCELWQSEAGFCRGKPGIGGRRGHIGAPSLPQLAISQRNAPANCHHSTFLSRGGLADGSAPPLRDPPIATGRYFLAA